MADNYIWEWSDVLTDEEYFQWLEDRAYSEYGPQSDHTEMIYQTFWNGEPETDF